MKMLFVIVLDRFHVFCLSVITAKRTLSTARGLLRKDPRSLPAVSALRLDSASRNNERGGIFHSADSAEEQK